MERKRKEGKQIHRDCSSSRDGDDDGRREESQRITGIEDQFEGATEAGGQTDARSRSVRVMHCSERERERASERGRMASRQIRETGVQEQTDVTE